MKDKITFTISDSLREFIESIVEEIILEGKSFQGNEKYINRFCEAEGIDYAALRTALFALFNASASFKATGTQSDEQLISKTGKDCYLSEEAIHTLINSLKDLRNKEEAKQREKESAERKKNEEQKKKEKENIAAQNRELLLKNDLFNSFPVVRDELLTVVYRDDFYGEYFWGYQNLLDKLHTTTRDLRNRLSDRVVKQSSDYQSFLFSVNQYLDKASTLHCSDLLTALNEGKLLLDKSDQLHNQALHEIRKKGEEKEKEKEIKRKMAHKASNRASIIMLIVCIILSILILSLDISWWLVIICEGFLFMSCVWVTDFVYNHYLEK